VKKSISILLISIIFIAFGCDQVDVSNPNLTYKEDIVVRAELKADNAFEGVTFTKTLPANEAFNIQKAELKDVIAYLKINGTQVIPLHYTQNGVYLPLQRYVIRPGYTYELYAEENGNYIYSKTTVPQKPFIQSALLTNNGYINTVVTSSTKTAYGAVWVVLNPGSNSELDNSSDFQTIVLGKQDTTLNLSVRTSDLPEKYKSINYQNSLYARVYSFDPQYADYFNTRNSDQPVSNPFVQGGDQVFWNVYGNNVIGLFVGMNMTGNIKVQ
jgi:hypothetical protein